MNNLKTAKYLKIFFSSTGKQKCSFIIPNGPISSLFEAVSLGQYFSDYNSHILKTSKITILKLKNFITIGLRTKIVLKMYRKSYPRNSTMVHLLYQQKLVILDIEEKL
jgi:hypothetical protein